MRVFYEEESNNNAKSAALRETRYDLKFKMWSVQDNPIVGDALVGTRLAVVSEKGQNEVRLYYQGTDLVLREMYCRKWRWDPNCTFSFLGAIHQGFILITFGPPD